MQSQHFRHPRQDTRARLINYLANAPWLGRIRRAVMSRLPALTLESDVHDVLYITWMVSANLARCLVPTDAKLLEVDGKTPFTILSYRHGHFGPAFFGRLRRWLFPSPLQSNWRLYLAEPLPNADAVCTVAFVQNILDSELYALGTRIFSDALLAHLPAPFTFQRRATELYVAIDPGNGSAASFEALARVSVNASLPHTFTKLYANWGEAVAALCQQDAAVCPIPHTDLLALARIDLPISLRDVQPFTLLHADCPMLATLEPDPEAICLLLPKVRFRVISERVLAKV